MDVVTIIALLVLTCFTLCIIGMIVKLSENKGEGFKEYFRITREERRERNDRRKNKERE